MPSRTCTIAAMLALLVATPGALGQTSPTQFTLRQLERQPGTVLISPGYITIIEFPDIATRATSGNPALIKVQPRKSSNVVEMTAAKLSGQTDLVVMTGGKIVLFVIKIDPEGKAPRRYTVTGAGVNRVALPTNVTDKGVSADQGKASTAALPAKVAYKGVSAAMWAEVDAQAAKFGDPHNCHARVDAIPKSGQTINPGGGDIINDALGKSDTVILKGGMYTITQMLNLSGKTLIGAAGEEVIINASGVQMAVRMGSNSVLANVKIVDARDTGVELRNNSTLYRVSVARTGRSSRVSGYLSTNGKAYEAAEDGSGNNCLVSTEARDSYNYRSYDGTSTGEKANGGNGDGYLLSGNTVIDSYSYNNSSDGFDFWESKKPNYVYFSAAFDMGKSPLGFPNIAGKGGGGSGFVLGRGDQVHYIYKSKSYNNKRIGFDLSDNTSMPVIIGSESYDNGGKDWSGGLTGNTK